ncbi:MAG: Peptide chain release factor N(5)-glutamine methyltransferase [Cytophagales bacterium]|jgi:release factor glutamine methyltransferase|nr:peptide chain release factor N(5)-glutamine methyltransferase [Bacteroidota bacterium]WHZ07692.1 MAG: Peptide chain release factor N(5)-glutamine methyltransferase [Cytophagales bacterium]
MNEKMTNSKILFESVRSNLITHDKEEAQAIALLVMSHFYSLSLSEILSEKPVPVIDFSKIIYRLNRHEPVQYILGLADFYERKFLVGPSVLIPRPETELLVEEITKEKFFAPIILDVGTGSGCIAITLKLEIPSAKVYALDKSNEALRIAKQNAEVLNARINFIQADFLSEEVTLTPVDILVSNPPYIAESEKKQMSSTVLQFEPALALFVPDDDPLLFYRSIAEKSRHLLKPNGKIFVEINERWGKEVQHLLEQFGFSRTKIVKDLDNKDRIVIATR